MRPVRRASRRLRCWRMTNSSGWPVPKGKRASISSYAAIARCSVALFLVEFRQFAPVPPLRRALRDRLFHPANRLRAVAAISRVRAEERQTEQDAHVRRIERVCLLVAADGFPSFAGVKKTLPVSMNARSPRISARMWSSVAASAAARSVVRASSCSSSSYVGGGALVLGPAERTQRIGGAGVRDERFRQLYRVVVLPGGEQLVNANQRRRIGGNLSHLEHPFYSRNDTTLTAPQTCPEKRRAQRAISLFVRNKNCQGVMAA